MMVIWLVVWNMTGLWLSIILGMSSSQLTNSIIFQRGSFTTNQYGKAIKMDGQWLVNGYDMGVTIDMEKQWFQYISIE